MDSQQTPRSPAELAAGQTPPMAPPSSASPQNQQQAQGPRFSAANNSPADGPVRFPPALRHLDSLARSQLSSPSAPGQFSPPRPPYGPAPQRAPPPIRSVFFPARPPQPGLAGAAPPARFPAGVRPPQPFNQQGFPSRAPFPPPGGDLQPRGLGLVRPSLPPNDQRQPVPVPPGSDRRGQFRPQMSIERMAEVQINSQQQQQRPSPDAGRPKSAISDSEQPNADDSGADQPAAGPATEEPSTKSLEANSRASSPAAKTPSSDTASIKGFDDGQRKSLSSPCKSPASSPVPAISEARELAAPKKKTTFADQDEDGRTMKKSTSARSIRADAENDSGVDESTQRRETPKANGVAISPTKKSLEADKRSTAGSPVKSPSKSAKSLPRTPDAAPSTASQEKKKVPMNKVQVGAAPSPNLKAVRSKIGSLENATYKPGGGKVKIENRKLDFSKAQPKIAAKNEKYMPSGGEKKIQQVKLQWNAKPKIGSLENTSYKPGGGDKKIETVKLDFKEKAKPKVGSKENTKHVPGGGTVKSSATPPKTPQDNANNIETQKLDIKAESKVGSLDNLKHKPGGGEKKIFDDKTYLRQTSSNVGSVSGSGSQSPIPSGAGSTTDKNGFPVSDENLNQEC